MLILRAFAERGFTGRGSCGVGPCGADPCGVDPCGAGPFRLKGLAERAFGKGLEGRRAERMRCKLLGLWRRGLRAFVGGLGRASGTVL